MRTKWLSLLLLVTNAAGVGAASDLPRIRIAKDGRTFADENGTPFVPIGVNYYRPGTGWAPQIWKTFDADATRKDFGRMKELGVNCVRVFLTYHSFHSDPGVLKAEGIEKFDKFLGIAEEAGIYVHPAGPEFWEGPPNWKPVAIADERTLTAAEKFWKLFAARYRGRNVIFAYDLKNEPDVGWKLDIIKPQWNEWLKQRYGSTPELKKAWNSTNNLEFGSIPIPEPKDALKSPGLLDFQSFREHLADEWTRRQAEAIKSSDPDALVTVGCLQTSVPSRFWGGIDDYTGYRPERQAKFLDFLEIHFYPSEGGGYEYKTRAGELANLAYLEGIVREVARAGKPVVLAEFGWYGGAEKPKFDKGAHPQASEEQQAEYCRHVVETSSGFAVGWLNWGFYDHPEATDCSELTGLLTADGKIKGWGKTFHELSRRYAGQHIAPKHIGLRPTLDWDSCVTSAVAANEFRKKYRDAFLSENH
jgi:endo-1,4-beta-mannosidase